MGLEAASINRVSLTPEFAQTSTPDQMVEPSDLPENVSPHASLTILENQCQCIMVDPAESESLVYYSMHVPDAPQDNPELLLRSKGLHVDTIHL
jgi:hypothetical protein